VKKTVLIGIAVVGLFLSVRSFQRGQLQKCFSGKRGICQVTFQNPEKLNRIRWGFFSPVKRVPTKGAPREKWLLRLGKRTREAPLVKAIQVAIWQGNFSLLPFWLIQKYRERGLLPVLALSGQHVWALCFCFSVLGLGVWRKMGNPRGRVFFVLSQCKTPLAMCLLFSFAWSEPSMVRTVLCGGIAFLIQQCPLKINLLYVTLLGSLVFLILFPSLLSSIGFVLSASGFIGVITAASCFSSNQKVLSSFWLILWFMPLIAFYFGKWAGASVVFQLGMGFIWDQIFLPLLFLGGFFVWLLPEFAGNEMARFEESILRGWINWEARNADSAGISIYRPSLIEVGIFMIWLVALAYWNYKRLHSRRK